MISSLNKKYENKCEKSGSEDEPFEFMLRQCCGSLLTCSSLPSCREKRGEKRVDRKKVRNVSRVERSVTERKRGKQRRRGPRRFRKLSYRDTRVCPSRQGKIASTRPIGQIPRGVKSRSTHTSSPTVIGGSFWFH